ncbi:hypothetical protein S245_041388 [Arachis hypogaea]
MGHKYLWHVSRPNYLWQDCTELLWKPQEYDYQVNPLWKRKGGPCSHRVLLSLVDSDRTQSLSRREVYPSIPTCSKKIEEEKSIEGYIDLREQKEEEEGKS